MSTSARAQWYSWGSGASGLLAHGDIDDSDVATLIAAPPFTGSTPVASLACSGMYSLLCTTDGELWQCGDVNQSSSSGQPLLLLPARIAFAKRIVSVACGWSHCGCISDDGELYMWGNNKQQQLGLPTHHTTAALPFSPTPTLVPLPSPVLSVACGWRHSLVLTRSYQLLGWGDNRAGQLFAASASSLPVPTVLSVAALPASSHVASVQCGWRFSLLVSSCGRVYCCGDNKYGQCGVSGGVKRVEQWTEVTATVTGVQAVQAAVGWTHCLLLDSAGRVWTFGRRSMGQAGTGRPAAMAGSSAAAEQVLLPANVSVTSVACGSESCLCVDSDGGLWGWGWNEHGNVGRMTGSEQIVWEPQRLQVGDEADARVVAAIAGGASVFAAVADTSPSE